MCLEESKMKKITFIKLCYQVMFFLIELIHLLSRQTCVINSLIVSIESKKKYETTLLKEYCNVNAFMNFASVQNLHLLIKVSYASLECFVAFEEGKKNLENYINTSNNEDRFEKLSL